MLNKPSLVTHQKLRFLIMDAPSRENAEDYAMHLNLLEVKHLVRTCESNYEPSIFERHGIQIYVKSS
jgi:hypothetical protein